MSKKNNDDGKVMLSAQVTAEQAAFLAEYGDGNLSSGLRNLIDRAMCVSPFTFRVTHPESVPAEVMSNGSLDETKATAYVTSHGPAIPGVLVSRRSA